MAADRGSATSLGDLPITAPTVSANRRQVTGSGCATVYVRPPGDCSAAASNAATASAT